MRPERPVRWAPCLPSPTWAAGPRRPAACWPRASTEAKDAALARRRRPAGGSGPTSCWPPTPSTSSAAEAGGVSPTVVDRLRLTEARVDGMAGGLRQVAGAAPTRSARCSRAGSRPNGLRIAAGAGAARRGRHHLREPAQRDQRRRRAVPQVGQRRLPAGLVGRHRRRTSPSPACCARRSPRWACPRTRWSWSRTPSREAAVEFMRQRDAIDCLIPRGGPSLIRSILDNATVPYVIDGDGNCHVYVDAAADLDMAARHRRQRQDPAAVGVQRRRDAARARGRGRRASCRRWPPTARRRRRWSATSAPGRCCPAPGRRRHRGRLGQRVPRPEAGGAGRARLDDAIAHIARYGSGHSEAIVTADLRRGRPLHRRGRRRRGAGQRLDPLRRRRGVRLRRRDRHLHPEAARPRARWACAS